MQLMQAGGSLLIMLCRQLLRENLPKGFHVQS
jgi:hypothetical protein